MAYRPDGAGKAACQSAVAGALSGWALLVLVMAGTIIPQDWQWPGWLRFIDLAGGYLVVTLPPSILVLAISSIVSLIGLGLFGYPLTRALGSKWRLKRMAPLAITLGAICGALFFGFWVGGFVPGDPEPGRDSIQASIPGTIFGATTGFWWWFFYRRVLLARIARDDDA